MMANTHKQLIQFCSIVYLILVTALSAYATSRVVQLALPIPRGLAYSATVLPLCSALLLKLSRVWIRRLEQPKRQLSSRSGHSPIFTIANVLVIIYSTTIITLLGTYVAPSSDLECGLRERWLSLFRNKDDMIRILQDVFRCCGFKNSRDMAWPFPDKTHRADACELAFERTQGCLDGWRGEERRLAGILMAVVGLSSLWQLCSVLVTARQEPWLHQIVPGRISHMIADGQEDSSEGSRRRIAYTSASDQFYEDDDENHRDIANGDGSRSKLDRPSNQVKAAPTDETSEDQEPLIRSSV